MVDKIVWERDVETTAAELAAQGIGSFIFTYKASNMSETLGLFENNGYKVHSLTNSIELLNTAAKAHKRFTAVERAVENEKYAFRCFLLKLGFIGDEYRAARKILPFC